MSYSDLTLTELENKFNLIIQERVELFPAAARYSLTDNSYNSAPIDVMQLTIELPWDKYQAVLDILSFPLFFIPTMCNNIID